MQLKKPTKVNAAHNYQAVIEQTYAAIDLLEKDPETRKALKAFAIAMTVTETNAGQHSMLHNSRPFIGPSQMNNAHAYAMRNSKEGLALRDRLMQEESLPANQRNPDAQLLLNNGATAGVWTVSRANPYQNQGVLGAVSTIIAAKAAAKATGKDITQLSATEVWLPHKLGINGGTAVLKAYTEDPETLVSDVKSAYGKAVSKGAYNNNFKGNYATATVEDIVNKTHAKFQRKVNEGVVGRLTPEQQTSFFAYADVEKPHNTPNTPPASSTQIAQAPPIPLKRPDPPKNEQPNVSATPAPAATPQTTPAAPPAIVASVAPPAPAPASRENPPLKPIAPLDTRGNTDYRRLANNLVGLGYIEAAMKPVERAAMLAKYIQENGGVKNALTHSMDAVKTMQVALQSEGMLKGEVDGLYGNQTREAHLAYRTAHQKDPHPASSQLAQGSPPPKAKEPDAPPPPSQANLPASQPTPVVIAARTGGRAVGPV